MDGDDFLTLLRDDLIEEGGLATDGPGYGGMVVTRYMGRNLEHPTTIRTTRDAFHAYLDSKAANARSLWPEALPRRAAYNLFLVHLDEEMTVLAGNPDAIDITASGMTALRTRPDERPTYPPGDYEWRAGGRGPSAG